MPTDPATVPTLTPEWCVEAYYRVNPGSSAFSYIPSLYLLDFAREVAKLVRVDTAEVERRAKYEALTEARSVAMRPGTWEQVDDRLKAFAEKYAPAPVASAPEGFTDRTEWDDKATIVNPAWCATEVDIENAKREAARKALAECAAWLGKGESQPVRFDEDGRFLLAFERVNAFSDRYLAREHPAPAPRECRKHEGDFFGVPLYSDPNCPADRVVFEYEGKAVACALIHPDSTALRRNAAEVGQ